MTLCGFDRLFDLWDKYKATMDEIKLEPLDIQDPVDGIRVRTDLCDSLSLPDQAPTMAGANSGSGGGGLATEPPLPNSAVVSASSSSKHYRWVIGFLSADLLYKLSCAQAKTLLQFALFTYLFTAPALKIGINSRYCMCSLPCF